MLRKMYLVPAEKYPAVPKHSPPHSEAPTVSISSSSTSAIEEAKEEEEKEDKKQKRHPYEKWVKYRKKTREDDNRRITQKHAIADFLQKVLPKPPSPTPPPVAKASTSPPPPTRRLGIGTQTTPEKNKLSPYPRLQRKHSPRPT